MEISGDAKRQRQYYSETAENYIGMHVDEQDEHYFALAFMLAILDHLRIKSILDVGSGTGRALEFLKSRRPDLTLIGIEPVKELREIGYKRGIPADQLTEGDATNLKFLDGEFDLVCEFGILHHIKRPEAAVSEMLRVGRKAVFISDSNNFGQGSFLGRSIKQGINSLGLWKAADFIKTRGRGYTFSEGDGVAYSYSVFQNYRQIRKQCSRIHLMNTLNGGVNPYRSAHQVALLGIKDAQSENI